MKTNYADELARWVEVHRMKGRATKVAVFHDVSGDVREALEAGFSAKTIWANLRESGRIDFRYETFLKYVNRALKTRHDGEPGVLSGARILADRALQASAPPPTPPARRAGMATFKFNPVPTPREDAP